MTPTNKLPLFIFNLINSSLIKRTFKKGSLIKDKNSKEVFVILASSKCAFWETCHDSKFKNRQWQTGDGLCDAISLDIMKIAPGTIPSSDPIFQQYGTWTCSKYFTPVKELSNESDEERSGGLQEDTESRASTAPDTADSDTQTENVL